MMIRDILTVMLGSAFGGSLRYVVTILSKSLLPSTFLFASTLFINVLGSFIIGMVLANHSAGACSETFRLLVAVGFCGGFTTFSTFSAESLALLNNQQYLLFGLYVLGSVAISLLGVWLGYLVCRF